MVLYSGKIINILFRISIFALNLLLKEKYLEIYCRYSLITYTFTPELKFIIKFILKRAIRAYCFKSIQLISKLSS
jgi:hypothetical protein